MIGNGEATICGTGGNAARVTVVECMIYVVITNAVYHAERMKNPIINTQKTDGIRLHNRAACDILYMVYPAGGCILQEKSGFFISKGPRHATKLYKTYALPSFCRSSSVFFLCRRRQNAGIHKCGIGRHVNGSGGNRAFPRKHTGQSTRRPQIQRRDGRVSCARRRRLHQGI